MLLFDLHFPIPQNLCEVECLSKKPMHQHAKNPINFDRFNYLLD